MIKRSTEFHSFRFPAFNCINPACGAKHIAYALSCDIKNQTALIPIERYMEEGFAEYVIVCPKCKSRFILRQQQAPYKPYLKEQIPSENIYCRYSDPSTRQ